MTVTVTTPWDTLHQQARHRLEYPSEHVVRFLAGVELDPDDRRSATAVDIGCGSGRHAQLLAQFGYAVSACDVSEVAVKTTRKLWGFAPRYVKQADMTMLPYPNDHFDVAVAFGVFYYGSRADHAAAATEMGRVLRLGGYGFVCVRTVHDWRNAGRELLRGEPEDGMELDFLAEHELRSVYGGFPSLKYELVEETTHGRTRRNSDWLITMRK